MIKHGKKSNALLKEKDMIAKNVEKYKQEKMNIIDENDPWSKFIPKIAKKRVKIHEHHVYDKSCGDNDNYNDEDDRIKWLSKTIW